MNSSVGFKSWLAPALVAASAHFGLALVPVTVGGAEQHEPQLIVRMALPPPPEPEIQKRPASEAAPAESQTVEARPEPPIRKKIAPPKTPRVAERRLVPEAPVAVERDVETDEAREPVEPEPSEREAEEPEVAVEETGKAASPARNTPPRVPRARAETSSSSARVDWSGYQRGLYGALLAQRRYPAMARRMGLEGVARVRLVIARDGRLAAPPRVTRSTGHELLDAEALRMVRSAAPFAALPAGSRRGTVAFEVPVRFRLQP